MKILFEGPAHASFFFGSLLCSGIPHAGCDSFAGQRNGLLGAARPGALMLMFGVHTDSVALRMLLTDSPPELDARWEEAVEVSFSVGEFDPDVLASGPIRDGSVQLMLFDSQHPPAIRLPAGEYRVRYTSRNFGAQEHANHPEADRSIREEYELTFWPDILRRDAILKVTSVEAQGWHDRAR